MSKYLDGFILPIPTSNIEEYQKIATLAAQVWKEHGALEYIEAVGEDLHVTDLVPFPNLVGVEEGETVILAYIVFESRAHRDAVNAKVMADPRLKEMCDSERIPFDFKRMAYGGFQVIVEG